MNSSNCRSEVIRGDRLEKSYFIRRNEFPVLKGINLRVEDGEVVVITGKSGAGKTTLISLLSGLEPPTAGDILWQGKPVCGKGARSWHRLRKKEIGIIFQDYNLITAWTALENVEAPLLFRGIEERKRRMIATDLMDRLDILYLTDNRPGELSEGQQQRVAVARTMALSPRLILADEPTGGVDPDTGDLITESLLALVRDGEASMLLATHGGNSLTDIADRAFRLNSGVLQAL